MDPILPTHRFEHLLAAEPLEERLEFAAWDPPGDWTPDDRAADGHFTSARITIS